MVGNPVGGAPRAGFRVGVDIGGTFTDIVLWGPDGRMVINKTSSTLADPGQAVIQGLQKILGESGVAPSDIVEIVHGTTVASNAILERKGARTGLLTTKGFRDVLEIGRIRTPSLFDLTWDKPKPLVRRRWRLEVDERIGADGSIVRPLDRAGVEAAAERFRREGVESITICFLNSYRNPVHEQEAEGILRRCCPGVNVTASYRVLPEMKEYERTSTTVVNAYIQPAMKRYLSSLSSGLRGIGIVAPLLVLTSNGGVVGAEAASEKPVFAVGSGPAAGVAGAARLGSAIGISDMIVFDMGGTTAKASLVEGGRLSLTSEYEFREGISTPSRFIKAGGYMLKVAAVDIAEVGSGAGSIAWIDKGGLLNVGPQSAGADPGPAAYGLGGERPTVTDANLVLGYLNPEALAGGTLKLDASRAKAAIETDVAGPLGLSVVKAAHGIRRVVNANMTRAIRSVTVERGRDPRPFTLIAFGGSGPVHAVDLARALEIRRVLVPMSPGVFTAVGMLASDVEHHFVRTHVADLDEAAITPLNGLMQELRREAVETLRAEGYPEDRIALAFQLDLRFVGQGSELTIPIAGDRLSPGDVASLDAAFRDEYAHTYGSDVDDRIEVVNARLIASGIRAEKLRFESIRRNAPDARSRPSKRSVYFSRENGYVDTVIHDVSGIGRGVVEGPAIIESYDSTIAIPPGCVGHGDEMGNLMIEIGGKG